MFKTLKSFEYSKKEVFEYDCKERRQSASAL